MKTDNVREDRELEDRAKLLFDESVAALDAETRSKLTRARYRALEGREAKAASAWGPTWVPAGAVAAGVLAAMVLWQGQPSVSTDPQSFDVAAVSDLEILLGDEELEMIAELEFYAWLDELGEIAPTGNAEGGVG